MRSEQLAPGVTLYCGDCAEILPTIGYFDALITDPPYGIGFAAQPMSSQRARGMDAKEWDDTKPTASLLEMVRGHADVHVIWGGNYFPLRPSRGWLCWYKSNSPPSMADCELAWTNLDRNAKVLNRPINSSETRYGHPTQKPIEVMRWTLAWASTAHKVRSVLDPFMGSGTTGVAAVERGLRFTGIELDPTYFDICCRRVAEALKSERSLFADEAGHRRKPAEDTQSALTF